MDDPVTIALDRPRPIRWTERAAVRLSRVDLDFPTAVAQLNQRTGLYALCALIWAALTERDQPYATPEDLAPYLATPAQQATALASLRETCTQAGLLQEEKKSPAPAASAPGAGPGSSSRPASAPRKSTRRT